MSMSEGRKKEIMLSLNVFNEPTELQGPKAWAQMITNLLYMKKGSFPSCPDMGIDIRSYQYQFLDHVRMDLTNEVKRQVATYFPEIPLVEFDITSKLTPGFSQPVVYVILTFYDNNQKSSVVVASAEVYNIINFAISM